jgi:hypothetical protein
MVTTMGLTEEEIIESPMPSNEKVSHPRGFFVFIDWYQISLENDHVFHRALSEMQQV